MAGEGNGADRAEGRKNSRTADKVAGRPGGTAEGARAAAGRKSRRWCRRGRLVGWSFTIK